MAAVVAMDTQLMLGVGLIGEDSGSLSARPCSAWVLGSPGLPLQGGARLGPKTSASSAPGLTWGLRAGGRGSVLRLMTRFGTMGELGLGCACLRLPESMGDTLGVPGATGRTCQEVAEPMLKPVEGDPELPLPRRRTSCPLIQVFLEFLHGYMWDPG